MNPKTVKNVVIHCSAGFGNKDSILAFWKSKGWRSVGYHRLIETNGTIHKLADFNKVTNGVLNHNHNSIHICYIGGIEVLGTKEKPIFKPKDTRTLAQKESILKCIKEALDYLKANGNDLKGVRVLGHRDFSPDKNGNGIIESWERIKDCPSFDAIKEYKQ